jgi:hypothetical protein
VLLLSCGQVHFVETRPPRLFHAQAEWRTGAAPEPVLWMPVLDLFIERPQDCAPAKAWTLAAVRAAMSANEMFKIELGAQDLSPQCNRRSGAVRGVEFTDRELPQGLSGCLRAQILGWTFQDIDLPSDVEVLITFTLSPRA